MRKIILTLIIIVSSLSAVNAQVNRYDLNGDGAVNGSDVTILTNFILENKTGKDMAELTNRYDLNGDGAVNGSDVTVLTNYILGMEHGEGLVRLTKLDDNTYTDGALLYELAPTANQSLRVKGVVTNALSSITIPKKCVIGEATYIVASISEDAFIACEQLDSVTIPYMALMGRWALLAPLRPSVSVSMAVNNTFSSIYSNQL